VTLLAHPVWIAALVIWSIALFEPRMSPPVADVTLHSRDDIAALHPRGKVTL
jgi:uncharacterized protein (DUF486 family)